MTHAEQYVPQEGEKAVVNGQIALITRYSPEDNWLAYEIAELNSPNKFSGHISNTRIEKLDDSGLVSVHESSLDDVMDYSTITHGGEPEEESAGKTRTRNVPEGGKRTPQSPQDEVTTSGSVS